MCYTEKAEQAQQHPGTKATIDPAEDNRTQQCMYTQRNQTKLQRCLLMCRVTRRKQERPGDASNDNTTHVPTARSSADLTKLNNTPTRHTLTKGKVILQMATPQAASSQRTHGARTQGRGRTHPATRRATIQYLHTQVVPADVWCGVSDDGCMYVYRF